MKLYAFTHKLVKNQKKGKLHPYKMLIVTKNTKKNVYDQPMENIPKK